MNPSKLNMNSQEYKNLEMVASMLQFESPNGTFYNVEETYFDYGQDWKWTTIIAYGRTGTYQAIYPKDWEDIILADGLEELVKITHRIRSGKHFLDK